MEIGWREVMDFTSYVKELQKDEKWEVKIGAGIAPIIMTKADIIYWTQSSLSTFTIPNDETIAGIRGKLKAVEMVRRHIAETSNRENS